VPTNLTACTTHSGKGTYDVSWLLGPFTSTGGNDWWTLRFQMLGEQMLGVPQDVVVGRHHLTYHDSDSDTPSEAIVGLPPLHNHHTETAHVCADASVLPALGYETIVFTQGDAECHDVEDGVACLDHDLLAMNLSLRMCGWTSGGSLGGLPPAVGTGGGAHFNSVVNDVRPAGSPPLRWYVNASFRLVERGALAPSVQQLNQIGISGPPRLDSRFNTFDVPSDDDSFAIQLAQWPTSGTLITDPSSVVSHLHSHQEKFHYAFIFEGAPSDVGLDQPRFYSPTGCDTVPTSAAGYESNGAMLAALVAACPKCFDLAAADTPLLCRANSSHLVIDGIGADRASSFDCRAPRLPFVKGRNFTILGFYGPRPSDPPSNALYPLTTPGYTPQHLIWSLEYIEDDPLTADQTFMHKTRNWAGLAPPFFNHEGYHNASVCVAV